MTTVVLLDDFDRSPDINPGPAGRSYNVPFEHNWVTTGATLEGNGWATLGIGTNSAIASTGILTGGSLTQGLVLWDTGSSRLLVGVRRQLGLTIITTRYEGPNGAVNIAAASGSSTADKALSSLRAQIAAAQYLSIWFNDDLIVDGYNLDADIESVNWHIQRGTTFGFYAGYDVEEVQAFDWFRLEYETAEEGGTAILVIPTELPVYEEIYVGTASRSPIAYGPRVEGSDPPPPLVVNHYRPDDLATPVGELTLARTRHWIDQLNEPGSASLVLQNDDPALESVADGDVLRFEVNGYAAFAALVRERDQVTISPGEDSALTTQLSGPGVLAQLDTALVYPARGIGSMPIQEDRAFNWTSPDYDDTAWIYSTALVPWGDPNYYGSSGLPPLHDPSGEWGSYWGTPTYNVPQGWPTNGTPYPSWWIWANVPNALEWAPPGSCYFRKLIQTSDPKFLYFVVFDGLGDLYLDGQLIVSGDYGVEPDVNTYSGEIDVSPGLHTLAIRCENDSDPEADAIHNPGGVLFACYGMSAGGQWRTAQPLAVSDNSWKIVEYPPQPPGMTPGEVLRHVVGEAQSRGAFPGLTLAFTDDHDSDGNPWPEVGDIATKVGTDVLTFARELTGTYVDVWMEPSRWRLWAWIRDGRGDVVDVPLHGATDPLDPMSGNLTTLTHRSAR